MSSENNHQLGKTLWALADKLRGTMDADDFRDYMLALLFLRYLSDNYEEAAARFLGDELVPSSPDDPRSPLRAWYDDQSEEDRRAFEGQMREHEHYVIRPDHLWSSIAELARRQDESTLSTLQAAFRYIEEESFGRTFQGLFSEINLTSEKLGRTYTDRNKRMVAIIGKIAEGLAPFSTRRDDLGDAYEYLIGQFAAGSGRKAGEFYTPQAVSSVLSGIVALDAHDPTRGPRPRLDSVLDFACGSGSLLLNVRERMRAAGGSVGTIYGQESNITTYNLARMNMLLHGVRDLDFEIYHGDTLKNEWPMLRETNPARVPRFDAVVANPPFSLRWDAAEAMGEDARFKNHGVAPKSAADFAFLLHGLHHLKDDGTMAIILPHGVLFRGNAEETIRRKLLADGHVDAIIGLPANLFYSTGIPVCLLVLKKCKRTDDVLFINAAERFSKARRQNVLLPEHIEGILETYANRREEARFSRRVSMEEIERNGFNLNITRYVSTAEAEREIDLAATHAEIVRIEGELRAATARHNEFLIELGLPPLP